jgi:hypothetical protein
MLESSDSIIYLFMLDLMKPQKNLLLLQDFSILCIFFILHNIPISCSLVIAKN